LRLKRKRKPTYYWGGKKRDKGMDKTPIRGKEAHSITVGVEEPHRSGSRKKGTDGFFENSEKKGKKCPFGGKGTVHFILKKGKGIGIFTLPRGSFWVFERGGGPRRSKEKEPTLARRSGRSHLAFLSSGRGSAQYILNVEKRAVVLVKRDGTDIVGGGDRTRFVEGGKGRGDGVPRPKKKGQNLPSGDGEGKEAEKPPFLKRGKRHPCMIKGEVPKEKRELGACWEDQIYWGMPAQGTVQKEERGKRGSTLNCPRKGKFPRVLLLGEGGKKLLASRTRCGLDRGEGGNRQQEKRQKPMAILVKVFRQEGMGKGGRRTC